MKQLAAQPTLVKTATEEFLRYLSPVRGFGRTFCRMSRSGPEDLERQRAFNSSCPATVTRRYSRHRKYSTWLGRAIRKPRFGFGEHFCIGAALARLEINILFEELMPGSRTWSSSLPGPRQATVGQFVGDVRVVFS